MATVTRTTLGRLYAGGETPIANVRPAFNAADWIADGFGSVTVPSNRLYVNVSGVGTRVYASCLPAGSRSDVYVQANWVELSRTSDTPALMARYQNNAGQDFVAFGRYHTDQQISYQQAGGVIVANTTVRPQFTRVVRMQMRVSGSDMAGTVFSKTAGRNVELAGISGAAGSTGILVWNNSGFSGGQGIFDEYYATRSHILTVTSSLTTGWYVNLVDAADGLLASSANAVAGTATIDMYQWKVILPLAAKIEIRETATGNLLIADTPTESVWPGDEWDFTPSGGYTPPVIVSRLSRSTLGKLAAFGSASAGNLNVTDSFALADWTFFASASGGSVSIEADTNRLRVTTTSTSGSPTRGARYNALALSPDHFVLMQKIVANGSSAAGVSARIDPITPAADQVSCRTPFNFSNNYSLRDRVAGVDISTIGSAANRNGNDQFSLHGLWVRDNLADSRQWTAAGTSGPAEEALNCTLNPATNSEYGGVVVVTNGANIFGVTTWNAMRSAILRVTGPNSGTWQVRLRDRLNNVIYTSPSHTAGTVDINTLDELTVLYPNGIPEMAKIEIYEPASSTVISGPEYPIDRIWGGDVWAWDNPAPPGPSYPAGRLAHRKAGAQRLLLKR